MSSPPLAAPGPSTERRSERARKAILDAAMELCREVGFPALTIEGIARRAGVGKQTIYRWWPSKAAVLLEGINSLAGAATEFPSTGDLEADLRTQMTSVANLLASDLFAPYTRGLIPAAQTDPDVADSLLDDIVRPRVEACRTRLEQAQRDGQVRDDVDLDDAVELLYAPLYYRLLLHTRPVDPDAVPAMIELAIRGLTPDPSGVSRTG
jgi:AcrR family transcriptional regulator